MSAHVLGCDWLAPVRDRRSQPCRALRAGRHAECNAPHRPGHTARGAATSLGGMHVVRCMQAETAVPVHRLYQSKKSTQGARASSSAPSSNHQGDYFPPRQDGRSFAARPTCGGDGLLFATEGIGLCLEHRWAEYLTIIATGSFVPRVVWTASPTHRCPQPGFGRERRQGHVSRLSSSTSTRRTTRTSIDVLCLDRGVRICFGFLVHPAPSSDAPISARGSSVHGGSSQ